MKFWIQFTTEKGEDVPVWHIAYSPDFDAATQGHTYVEAHMMAQDLLYIHLQDGPLEAPIGEKPEGDGWEQVEIPLESEFALRFRWARSEAGLTMDQAAKQLGVSTGTYQRWESPKGNPTFKTAQKVLKSLGKRVEMKVSQA